MDQKFKIAGMIAYLRHQYDNGAPMPMFLSMIAALEDGDVSEAFRFYKNDRDKFGHGDREVQNTLEDFFQEFNLPMPWRRKR